VHSRPVRRVFFTPTIPSSRARRRGIKPERGAVDQVRTCAYFLRTDDGVGWVTTRIERLRERFEADPSDRGAFEAIEEQAFLRGDWSALVPVYERYLAAVESSTSPLEVARLQYRLGHALEEAGLDPERAEVCHRRALEIDPRFAPALRRLRRRCVAGGRWDEALALAVREADGAARPTERAALLAETAAACLRAGEHSLAVQAFECARAADADSQRAWLGLGEALEADGRFEDAIECWQQALDGPLKAESERATAQRALGRLLLDEQRDPAGALRVYEAAHAAFPEQEEWLESITEALRALGRDEEVVALADRRLRLARNPRARAAIALEAGRILLDVTNDPGGARSWLQRAADLRDEDGEIQLALAEAASRLGDTAGRTWHLERAMELGAEIPSWSDLGLGGDPPDGPDEARLAALRRKADERPANPETLAALADALAVGSHDQERAELLEQMAALATVPAERQQHLLALGDLYETRLDDAAAAAASYRMAFDLDPAHPVAFAALERVLRKLERNEELALVLDRAAAAAPPARRAELLCAAAELGLARGAEPRSALERFEAALDADARYARAYAGAARAAARTGDEDALLSVLLREAGQAGAERLATLAPELLHRLDEAGRVEEAVPVLRRHVELAPTCRSALEALARTLEDLGDTEELSHVLGRLDALLTGADRGANQRRLGWLHAVEGRLEAAISAWRAAVRHDPSDAASLEALLDAFAETDRSEDALALLDALAERGIDATRGSRSVAMHRARALERGGRFAEAATAWRARHHEGDRSEELFEAWERCARRAGDAEALVDALAHCAAAATDSAARRRLDADRADLLERSLDRPGEARALWASLAHGEPESSEEASRRLQALLERTEDFAALCDHLVERSERATGLAAWALHVRVAELAETRLQDIGRARRHLEVAVALAPAQVRSWQRLASLYDEASQPAEWIRALEGEIAALEADPDRHAVSRRLELHVQAARAAEQQLDASEHAAEHWRLVLSIDPSHREAFSWLLGSCEADGRYEEAAGLLVARLERIPRIPGTEEQDTELRLRLADLLITKLDRPNEAIAVLESAPARGIGARACAERLADLYTRAGRYEECAALCESRSDEAEDAPTRVLWLARCGDALSAGGDATAAEAAHEAALRLDPDRVASRVALCDLLRARGDAVRLAEHLEYRLRREGVRNPALHRELATLHQGPLASPARALEHWIRLVSLDATDADAREHAVSLALDLHRIDDAVALLRSAATDRRTGAARVSCWTRCGDLLADRLGRPEEAVRCWRESLLLEPEQPALRRRLRSTLESLGCFEEALAELRREWRNAEGPERIALAAHGADLAATAVPSGLAPWLARLVADEPDDPTLWTAIADIHERAGRAAACEHALSEAARCAPDSAWRCALQRRRAWCLESVMADPGRACAALEAARLEDPDHPLVLEDLDRLYASARRPRESLDVLHARLAIVRHPALRGVLARRAAVLAASLGESEQAAESWLTALASLAPRERRSLLPEAVDALHTARRIEHWERLAEEELAGTPPPPAERARALRRALARAAEARGRRERALLHARALVDADASGGDDDDQRLLLDLLRADGGALERARRLEQWAIRAPEGRERADAWRELAQLREERLADPTGAAEAWHALLHSDPDAADGWPGVRRCAERCGDARELARALEAEIERGHAAPGASWRRLGVLRWCEFGDAEAAENAFLEARRAEPDDRTTLAWLQEITERTGRHARAAELAHEEIDLLGDADPERRRTLWLHIARIAHHKIEDPQRAADAFERAHQLGANAADGLADWAAALAATGAGDRWCEIFATWCDHPDARPAAADLLALARALVTRGLPEQAKPRLAHALALDPALAAAWRLSAELHESDGDGQRAATAWLRAAENDGDLAAAECWTRAAAHLETNAPGDALDALEHAVACAPDFAPAQAARARLAETQGQLTTAIAAAERLFAPGVDSERPDPSQCLAAALAGARAARQLARWRSAWQLAGEALALDPEAPDALAARGLSAFHLGAGGECRRNLAARLTRSAPDPNRPELLVALARALENSGELEAALSRHLEALEERPEYEDAHAGRLRVLEHLGRHADAAAALAGWAAVTESGARRAERYVRAARLARLVKTHRKQAEQWLLEALAAEPSHPTAWYELATGLWEEGRTDEAWAAASEGASCVASPRVRSVLETIRGHALAARGDEPGARAAFTAAVACDPEAREAALAGARLLRRSGNWREATEILRRAAEGHGDAGERAELFFESARILAGPLEDVEGALDAYDRARALAPERLDVREARAALLAQRPGREAEALSELAAVLDEDPLRVDAIRRATRIARGRGDEASARRGSALLRALGAASPIDRATEASRFDLACEATLLALAPAEESLRSILVVLAPLLEARVTDWFPADSPETAELEATASEPCPQVLWQTAARKLVGTPELLRLDVTELRAALETAIATAREGRLGREGSRALRRLQDPRLELVDLATWRTALRARVWARVADALDGDLRVVLAAIAAEAGAGTLRADEDLTPWLTESPEAAALLRPLLRAWLSPSE
jgi:tetratricopeptide (TPR) repeat protein